MHWYKSIDKKFQQEIKIKGSRFIGILFPIQSENDFKIKLEEIRNQFPDATHHCSAFRLDTEGLLERSSDDGEPSGTAGKPILGQLYSFKLYYAGIIVVRYYGGTKLGTGGLIKAYKDCAKLVIESAEICEKEKSTIYKIKFSHSDSGKIVRIINEYHIAITEKKESEYLEWKILVPERIVKNVFDLMELNGAKIILLPQ